MDKYTYTVVINRIDEIIQEQLSILDYLDLNLDKIIDQQKENMETAMTALKHEREGNRASSQLFYSKNNFTQFWVVSGNTKEKQRNVESYVCFLLDIIAILHIDKYAA